MWKFLRHLLFSVIIYWIMLYIVHKYSGWWFWVEATQYDVFLTFGILAVVFWIINNVVKVVLKILTIPLKYITFGLFSLVLNVLMIYIFEFLVNNSTVGVLVHLWTIVQVFLLSLVVTIIAFIIKKII
jgi:putative membrane protein